MTLKEMFWVMLADGGLEDAIGWLMFAVGIASLYLIVYALS